jgi:hypothetical protein
MHVQAVGQRRYLAGRDTPRIEDVDGAGDVGGARGVKAVLAAVVHPRAEERGCGRRRLKIIHGR